jgi:hypothetical protein
MNKAVQFHLLGMINTPVSIYFKKELYFIINAFINDKAIRN